MSNAQTTVVGLLVVILGIRLLGTQKLQNAWQAIWTGHNPGATSLPPANQPSGQTGATTAGPGASPQGASVQ